MYISGCHGLEAGEEGEGKEGESCVWQGKEYMDSQYVSSLQQA